MDLYSSGTDTQYVSEPSSLIDPPTESELSFSQVKPSDWQCNELCQWISRNVKNSEWLTSLFIENEIEGSTLVNQDVGMLLSELEIKKLGHKQKIIKLVKDLEYYEHCSTKVEHLKIQEEEVEEAKNQADGLTPDYLFGLEIFHKDIQKVTDETKDEVYCQYLKNKDEIDYGDDQEEFT